MRIGTGLLKEKRPLTVTLHGAGGIGKTALLRQALLRFAPSFDLTLALALDPLPSLESVLGRLEGFLGLPSPCANETKERAAMVRKALTSKRTLLGLDNFETLIHARDNGSDEEKKSAKSLYAFIVSLSAEGAALCITSRSVPAIAGESIEEIRGLEDRMGGALFYENVSTRRDALNEAGLAKLSAAVGGHPLALRLLARSFEKQAGVSLEEFIARLQAFLPKASDEWTEEERHASLGACFAFSLDNLPKDAEGGKLRIAISRLSVFTAFFADFTAAPVLENKWFESDEELEEIRPQVNNTLHALWERGLLERTAIPLAEENVFLYRLHPALGYFAKERLTEVETVMENYWQSMKMLAGAAEEQITQSPLMARIVSSALPDLLAAAESKEDRDAALMQFRLSKVLRQFGLYDDALRLLGKSRLIVEGLGDLRGKAATLHEMANIYATRGDLDGAMGLYQQSLEIKEGLGDLRGKAATLHEMAYILRVRGDLERAMGLYQQSLEIKEGLGDLRGKAVTIGEMAKIFEIRGNLNKALEMQEEKLAITKQLGDQRETSVALHNMAGISVTRGDLDRAMGLYQQSLEIDEGLGDLQGKAMTLGMMSQVYWARQRYKEAITFLLNGLMLLVQLRIEPQIQQEMASVMAGWRAKLGEQKFDALWKEITDSPLPEWLT
jgi:tetratricopeptide (TPR) repeat protein